MGDGGGLRLRASVDSAVRLPGLAGPGAGRLVWLSGCGFISQGSPLELFSTAQALVPGWCFTTKAREGTIFSPLLFAKVAIVHSRAFSKKIGEGEDSW